MAGMLVVDVGNPDFKFSFICDLGKVTMGQTTCSSKNLFFYQKQPWWLQSEVEELIGRGSVPFLLFAYQESTSYCSVHGERNGIPCTENPLFMESPVHGIPCREEKGLAAVTLTGPIAEG